MPLGAARLALLAKTQATAVAEVIRYKIGVSAVGNAQVDTAQSKFGGSSLLLDGTGDYLDMNPNITIGSSDDFTVEQWIYQDNYSATYDMCRMTDGGSDKIVIYINSSEVLYVVVNGSTIYSLNNTQHPLNLTTWHHIALTRSSGTIRLFIDGTQYGSDASNSADLGTIDRYTIGWNQSTGSPAYWDGNIDEVRVSNTARYTTGFTPSTAPFVNDSDTLLLLHMNGTDGSTHFEDDNGVGRSAVGVSALGNAQVDTAQYKFGGASALFDGTGDYLKAGLNAPDTYKWATHTDFTVEFWIRINDLNSMSNTSGTIIPYLVGNNSPSSGTNYWTFGPTYNGYLKLFYYTGTTRGISSTSGSHFSTGTWYHIAMVKESTTVTFYIDGTDVGSGTIIGTPQYSDSLGLTFGQYNSNSISAAIDEFRISDTARYTASFTAPTSAFVNDSDTLLLLHMNGTDGSTHFEDDNGVGRSSVGVTGNGSVQIDTAQSYFGGSSCLSTGSADSLLFDGSLIPLSGDFTIESWVRFTGTNSRKMLYSQYTSGTGRTSLEIETDEKASFFCASQSSFQEADRILSDSALSVDTWYHIAVVRDGSTFTMYIDGVAQADTISHSVNVQDQDFEIFGDDFGTHTDDVWQDEFRISNTARYTTGFTPSTEPFVNDENTLLLLHMNGTDGSTDFVDDNGTQA